MSFLTAILLLNMEAPDAFICLSNILTTKYLLACFCMDQTKVKYLELKLLLTKDLNKLILLKYQDEPSFQSTSNSLRTQYTKVI